MALGHGGYLETVRRAFVYTLRLNKVEASADEVKTFLECWQELSPFPEVADALPKLHEHYQLIALSNGDPWFLDHLAKNRIKYEFNAVISVEQAGGAFKPHPGVYRRAATMNGLEVGECMMVSANSFDVVGARACGFRGAWVKGAEMPEPWNGAASYSARLASGGQVHTRWRSPYALSMRPTAGQNLCSRTQSTGYAARSRE